MAASTHGGTCSHVAVAGWAWGGESGAAAAAAAAAARRRGATPTGGAVTPPRSAPTRGRQGARAGGWDRPPRDGAPLTVPRDGVRNRRRAAATEAGAQARSPAGHRGRVEPRKSLYGVAARNSGRWRGAGGQAPSRPCAAGPKLSSRARLLLGVLGRTDILHTALGLCPGCLFPKRAPKSSVRRDRCISTRKKRDTA